MIKLKVISALFFQIVTAGRYGFDEVYEVRLNVYDLSDGLAKVIPPIPGCNLDAIYHTGIVVYGKEYAFGPTGIYENKRPGTESFGKFIKSISLGYTTVSEVEFDFWKYRKSQWEFRSSTYGPLKHNCNTFTQSAAQFLVNRSIPREILEMPRCLLNASEHFLDTFEKAVDEVFLQTFDLAMETLSLALDFANTLEDLFY